MSIEKLKALKCRHGSNWRFEDKTGDFAGEVEFLNAFIGLRKELIALWEAVAKDRAEGVYEEGMARTDDALAALNAKAAEVLK